MATYVILGRYSEKAVHSISAERTKKVKTIFEKLGGKLKAAYAVLGAYDLIAVAELPDTRAAVKASLAMSRTTGISFTTLPAVTVEEFDALSDEARSLQ